MISNLPLYLLSLPVVLLALSIHEAAHGYAAYKLGDPTAYSMGRLTLNPLKHLDPIGFLCMVLFHIGWARPVPINPRYFKNPRRGMAISAAAGPISNLLLALIFALLLRLEIFLVDTFMQEELSTLSLATSGATLAVPAVAKVLSVLAYMLFIGVILNTSLAIFNLIPIPPFDGSRIVHVFLPAKWYFAIMKYERFIMIALLVMFWIFLRGWLSSATGGLASVILRLAGMKNGTYPIGILDVLLDYVEAALTL